ncbi:hypothetical protein [Polaribacter vadi]|uniref:hypothetical protein n=1 Tax=Polaribacter vadi TaxID=1774273 RepID=UPI0030EDA3A7
MKAFDLSSQWCIAARWGKLIGVETSKSTNGPWKRLDKPIVDVKPNSYCSYLTLNPSPLIKKDFCFLKAGIIKIMG